MKIIFISCLLVVIPLTLYAADLHTNQIYSLSVSIDNEIQSTDKKSTYTAAASSKFKVLDASQSDYYLVRFLKVYTLKSSSKEDSSNGKRDVVSSVKKDIAYLLPKKYHEADTSLLCASTISGPVSGPLIVPFKFRLDDRSVTGEATIGYYAGYSWSWKPGYDFVIPITPFISGGLSQVTVDKETGSDSKSAFTWATGILIQNWGNVNIGLSYGQDRTGDKTWNHEGKGWFSFMVGWKLE